MTRKQKLIAATTFALACAALGTATPASALGNGATNSPKPRPTEGAYVWRTEYCSTDIAGVPYCVQTIEHEIDVGMPSSMSSSTYGYHSRVTTPTGQSTSGHIAHELDTAAPGFVETNSIFFNSREDGCRTMVGSHTAGGTTRYFSRDSCP